MKIGIVCYPTYGGSGVVATELGKGLADKGHQVHFITYDRPVRLDKFASNIFYHQVNPEEYPLFEFLPYESALASKLVDVVRHAELDILHVHYAIPHASSTYMAQQILHEMGIDIPFVTTLHGTDITLVGKEEIYKPVVTFSINHSSGVTAVSDYLRKATLENFPVQKHIEVIPNFVDLRRFKRAAKNGFRSLLTPQGQKLLIHVSNFRKVKRVQDVYEVFVRLRERMPVRLLLVGDGPERSPVERAAREHGLTDEVIFLGKQEVIEQILPVADLFLIPSEYESFGLAALEAMACGIPVLSTNAGGLPEVIEHGKSGYMADVGDVATMTELAYQILHDEKHYNRFCEDAYARAQDFDIAKVLPLYEAFYTKTLVQNRS
jgi:N-acetyl-alpha-D-glucosaminyl L-malate synthase BshA